MVKPDFVACCASLLRQYGNSGALSKGKLIHVQVIKAGYEWNRYLSNFLVQMYGKCRDVEGARNLFDVMPHRNVFTWTMMVVAFVQCGQLEGAQKLFEEMPERNVVSWTAMITAHGETDQGKKSFQLFQQLQIEGVVPEPATFIAILEVCGNHTALARGKYFHSNLLQKHSLEIVTGTVLINMYSKCNCLKNVQTIFASLPQHDVVSWNAILAAYIRHGHVKEALQLFERMKMGSITPDKITYVIILEACDTREALVKGKDIHQQIVCSGFEADADVSTALVNMYLRCGSINDAQQTFDKMPQKGTVLWSAMISAHIEYGNLENAWKMFARMPQRDVVSWNAMICACNKYGQKKQAHELFHQMQLEGIVPNKVTFITILDACSKLGEVKEMHELIVENGYELDVVVGTALVNMYGKCKSLHDASAIFDKMPERNVVSWTSMISIYARFGIIEEAWKIFDTMPERNIVSWNAMIAACAQCGDLSTARKMFDSMVLRDLVSWNVIIAAYAQHGQGKETLHLFKRMQFEGFVPDKATFISALDACAHNACLSEGKLLHDMIVHSRLESDVMVSTALINMYGKCRRLEDAERLFKEMHNRNIVTWNTMISAYAYCGKFEDACKLFVEMPQHDTVSWNTMIAAYMQHGHESKVFQLFGKMQEYILPDEFTVIGVLDACASQIALTRGKCMHEHILRSRFHLDLMVGTALVNMYGKCGNLEDACLAFDRMPKRNVISWNTLVSAYSQHGHVKMAMQLLQQMNVEGVMANPITIMSILSSCSHVGLVDDGFYCFGMSRDHAVTPTWMHLDCMIDLLGRMGWLDNAEDFINNMPLKQSGPWLTLLGACRRFLDVERGNRAAENISMLDPENPAVYVLLSNTYASFYDDVLA